MIRNRILLCGLVVVATTLVACQNDLVEPRRIAARLAGNTAVPRGALQTKSGALITVDTITNEVRRPGKESSPLPHGTAVKLFRQFSHIQDVDAWVSKLEHTPSVLRAAGKANGRKAQYRLGNHRKVPSQSHSSGLMVNHGAFGTISSRGLGAGILSAKAPQGPQGPRGRMPLMGPGGNLSAQGFSDDDPCTVIELDIYNLTQQWHADKDAFDAWLAGGGLNPATFPPSEVNLALYEYYTAILYYEETRLGYLASQWNMYGCDNPPPTPDYDENWGGTSDWYWWYDAGNAEYCYDEYWDVFVSYDNGQTWSFEYEYTVSHCSS